MPRIYRECQAEKLSIINIIRVPCYTKMGHKLRRGHAHLAQEGSVLETPAPAVGVCHAPHSSEVGAVHGNRTKGADWIQALTACESGRYTAARPIPGAVRIATESMLAGTWRSDMEKREREWDTGCSASAKYGTTSGVRIFSCLPLEARKVSGGKHLLQSKV